MPGRGQFVDQRVVGAMDDVVEVLHADDRRDPARLLDLRRRDVAQAQVADEALLPKLRQRGELRLDRPFARLVDLAP